MYLEHQATCEWRQLELSESPVRNSVALKDGEAKIRVYEGRFRNVNLSFSLMFLLLKLGNSPYEANPKRQLSVLDIWQLSCALALNHLLHPQPSPELSAGWVWQMPVLQVSVLLQSNSRDMKERMMFCGKCSRGPPETCSADRRWSGCGVWHHSGIISHSQDWSIDLARYVRINWIIFL